MKQLDILEANNVTLSDMNEFAIATTWIRAQGGKVNRFTEDEINQPYTAQNTHKLPIVRLDGEIVLTGSYPTREQMQNWLNITEKKEKAPCCRHCGG